MKAYFKNIICQATGASSVYEIGRNTKSLEWLWKNTENWFSWLKL